MFNNGIVTTILSFVLCSTITHSLDTDDVVSNQKFKIEGKVVIPSNADPSFVTTTRVLVDGGEYLGFLKSDGTFTVNNIPTGSYVVDITNPSYAFEPTRVDVNSKGKIRARRLNNLQPSSVVTVNYPLRFKSRGMSTYFQKREQWKITDLLMNPMVMMMVLPFLMIMVLPKLINTQDPETQKEMQNQMNMLNPKQNMPEVSEMFTNWLSGGATKKAAKPNKPVKRRS